MGLRYFWDLLAQRERVEAFQAAITEVVGPEDVVLEVGTGLGTFALFAARAGARHVYAVDSDPVLHVAHELAVENGLADRMTFVRGRFPDVAIAEPATVILFEDFPPRVVDPRVVSLYGTLRDRFATPDARWIPQAVSRHVAPAGGAAIARAVRPFGDAAAAYGLTWRAARRWLEREVQYPPDGFETIGPAVEVDRLVTGENPDTWGTSADVRLVVEHNTSLEALLLWGDLHLAGGITLSNGPGSASPSWGRVLLPLVPPLPVTSGTAIDAGIRHDSGGGWMGWEVRVGEELRVGHELAGRPAAREDLLAGSPDAVPAVARRGSAARDLLAAVDGERSLEAVARVLGDTYPWMDGRDGVRLAASLLDELVTWHAPGGHKA